MLRAVAFCARACVKFKSSGTVSPTHPLTIVGQNWHTAQKYDIKWPKIVRNKFQGLLY